ncbi:MAG: GC-type dockerin domain-anchored protein [Planctomycetota bacterium]
MKTRTTTCIILAAAATAATAHEGDVGLAIIDGVIVTGIVEDGPGGEFVVPGERVFAAEFDLLGTDVYADEPGLFAEAGTFPDSQLSFEFAGPVRRWNGTSFDDVPAPETMTLEFGPLSATSPLSGSAPGFGINVGPAGFDEHYDFFLDAPANDGIFLVGINLSSDDPGIGAAETTYLVFNWNLPESEHDAAVEYVEDTLLGSTCAADMDGDGVLTLFDFLAFQNAFDAGDPIADFDGDGSLTLFDFLAFQNAFGAGC